MGALAGRPYGQIALSSRSSVNVCPSQGFLDALLARMGMETRQAAQHHREAVRNVQRWPRRLGRRPDPLDAFADAEARVDLLGSFRGRAGTITAWHLFRGLPHQQHQVASVTAGQLPFMGEAVPPPLCVDMLDPSSVPQFPEPDLDGVRLQRPGALHGDPQLVDANQARASAAGTHIPAQSTRSLGPELHLALFAALTRQDDRVSVQIDVRHQEIADLSQTAPGVIDILTSAWSRSCTKPRPSQTSRMRRVSSSLRTSTSFCTAVGRGT